MNLTVAYITSRPEPELRWFLESLANQADSNPIEIIVIDGFLPRVMTNLPNFNFCSLHVTYRSPKPTVWQGPHRLTGQDWWAAANARNTALCLCVTDWIAFVDDRSVLLPGWMLALKEAMAGNYALCGPYEKRVGVTVDHGYIRNAGIITGQDNRLAYVQKHYSDPRHKLTNPYKAPGNWWYGCTTALPLEWALEVNGYDEFCDGLSGEDYIFGMMLANCGHAIKFDTRFAIVEDRTSEKLGPAMVRRDKGESPNDKSHALLDLLKGHKRAQHPIDLREIRNHVQNGGGFPPPWGPQKDWYDDQPLSEMEPG